jgi:hypothetical protein
MLTFVFSSSFAQEQLNHEKKFYRTPEGRLYINKDLPVYLRISPTPDASDSYLLKSEETKEYTNPMYFDTEGYNSIRSPWKVDPKTKKTAYPKGEVIFEVYADSKAPSTKIDFGTNRLISRENKTIIGEKIKLTFQTYDAIAGVENIYYSINKTPYKAYKDPLNLNEEKLYDIKYYAVDHVGNVEEEKNISIQIDLTSPSTQMNIDGDQYKEILSGRSEISLSATDKRSQVKNIYYSLDDSKENIYKYELKAKYLNEGEHTITYYAVDEVGNREAKQSYDFYVDKTAPTVVDELMGNTFVANGKEYYSGRNKLKLVSMDNKAGVKEIRYSLNNGEFKLYQKPFYLSKSGNLKIEVLAIDNVNNRKRTEKLSSGNNVSYVDLSGPELGYNFKGPSFVSKDTVFISKDTKILLAGNDHESGFKKIEYRIGQGSETQTYNQPFSISKQGHYKVYYTGYDNLGNSSSDEVLCVVDNKGPEIYHRFSMDPENQKTIKNKKVDIYPPHVVLFLSSTDNFAGFDKMYYSINDSQKQLYKSLIEGFNENTFYKLGVTAVDKLGNKNKKEIEFYIE